MWEDLKTRYGQTKLLAKQIKRDLFSLPKIVDGPNIKTDLYEFHNICRSVLNKQATCPGLQSLDNEENIKQVVNKLPQRVLCRWKKFAEDFDQVYRDQDPPFRYPVKFLSNQASRIEVLDDFASASQEEPKRGTGLGLRLMHTEVHVQPPTDSKHRAFNNNSSPWFELHKVMSHNTAECFQFKKQTPNERTLPAHA